MLTTPLALGIPGMSLTACGGAGQGVSSKDFVQQLGYIGSEEIVHRDNICLLSRLPGSSTEALSRAASPAPGAPLLAGLPSTLCPMLCSDRTLQANPQHSTAGHCSGHTIKCMHGCGAELFTNGREERSAPEAAKPPLPDHAHASHPASSQAGGIAAGLAAQRNGEHSGRGAAAADAGPASSSGFNPSFRNLSHDSLGSADLSARLAILRCAAAFSACMEVVSADYLAFGSLQSGW